MSIFTTPFRNRLRPLIVLLSSVICISPKIDLQKMLNMRRSIFLLVRILKCVIFYRLEKKLRFNIFFLFSDHHLDLLILSTTVNHTLKIDVFMVLP
jgi:hypothetical protein